MSEWFDRAFGPWYEALYAHRDQDEADRCVALVEPRIPPGPLLDIAAGTGRHLTPILGAGRAAVGLDRSARLLAAAGRRPGLAGRIVRGDMRALPFRDRYFSGVLNLFTGFGYFRTHAEHEDLLREWRRVTRDGGVLVLDYLNEPRVRRSLRPESRRSTGAVVVEERRRIEPVAGVDRVRKELIVRGMDGGVLDAYEEDVALFSPREVERMLEDAGWSVVSRHGDYSGDPWSEESPRFLCIARAGNSR